MHIYVLAPSRLRGGEDESDMSYSEGFSGETGSETDDRPNSPRAAPVGKDNEMCRTTSVSSISMVNFAISTSGYSILKGLRHEDFAYFSCKIF